MPAAEREKPTQESFLFSSLILHPLFLEARRNQQWETVDSLQGSRPDVDVKAFSKGKVFFLAKRGTIRPDVDDRPFSKDEVVDLYSTREICDRASWLLENKGRSTTWWTISSAASSVSQICHQSDGVDEGGCRHLVFDCLSNWLLEAWGNERASKI